MVSVPLCTKLEMSDINKGNKGSPWESSIATLYHPPVRNEELRLPFLLAHSVANGEKRSWSYLVPHEYGRRVGMVPRSSFEGREEQSDGGEKNKDNQNNPPSLPHMRAVVDSRTLTSPQAGLPQGAFLQAASSKQNSERTHTT